AVARGLPQAALPQITVRHLNSEVQQGTVRVLDVREKSEFVMGHVPGAQNIPLGQLPERIGDVPSGMPLAVMCGGGIRSSSAASLLLRSGWKDVVNVTGGFDDWERARLPVQR